MTLGSDAVRNAPKGGGLTFVGVEKKIPPATTSKRHRRLPFLLGRDKAAGENKNSSIIPTDDDNVLRGGATDDSTSPTSSDSKQTTRKKRGFLYDHGSEAAKTFGEAHKEACVGAAEAYKEATLGAAKVLGFTAIICTLILKRL